MTLFMSQRSDFWIPFQWKLNRMITIANWPLTIAPKCGLYLLQLKRREAVWKQLRPDNSRYYFSALPAVLPIRLTGRDRRTLLYVITQTICLLQPVLVSVKV